MDFMALFTMGTEGHYITMLPAYWSISTSHDPFAFQFLCYGIHLYNVCASMYYRLTSSVASIQVAF